MQSAAGVCDAEHDERPRIQKRSEEDLVFSATCDVADRVVDHRLYLVLAGECTLIVEGEKRRLTEWDFFYCAPGTEHIIVTSGEQRAVVLAVGARGRGVGNGVIYKVCKAAARYGASVARETTDSAVAYAKIRAKLPRSRFVKYRRGWLEN
jgi:hypothetical protein